MSTATASTTSTGQFSPSIGKASQGGSSVVLGSTLYYFVPDSNTKMKICTCDVSGLQDSGDISGITSSSLWDDFQMNSVVPNSNSAHFKSEYYPSVVVQGTLIWFFWTDTHNSGQVYAVSFDGISTWSSTAIQLTTMDGTDLDDLTTESSICANVFGDKICLNWYNTKSNKIHTGIFDPVDIDTSDNTWQGTEATKLNPNSFGKSVDSTYDELSTMWFSLGSEGNFMVASCYSKDDNKAKAILYPINDDGSPASSSSSAVFGMDTVKCSRGFMVDRDPSGRLYGIYATQDSDHDLKYSIFNTNQDFSSGASPDLSWGSSTDIYGGTKDTEKAIDTCFLLGNEGTGTIDLADPEGDVESFDCTTYEAFQFVFYADHDGSNDGYDIQCQVGNYGTSYVVPNYSAMVPLQENIDNYTLSMVFDPFPFPNENIGSTQPGETVISYTYGTSSETDNSIKGNYEILFGIKATFDTTKGVGPALATDFATGPESSFANTDISKMMVGWTMNTGVVDGGNGDYEVSNKGRFDGHTLMTISQTAAVFYDADGNAVNGDTAPVYNSLVPVPGYGSYSTSGTYDVYTATPGDINSYTETAINATMADLYKIAVNAGYGDYFIPEYAEDYIEDVITPRAVEFSPGKNYLEFTISTNGGSQPSFSQIQEVYSSIGLKIQSSLYAGVGFGEEISTFGFGEAASGSLTAGFECEMDISSDSTSSEGWGVSSQYSYPNNVPGSYHYAVRMYICKPDELWVNELQYMAQNVEDAGEIEWSSSVPLKVVFVVDGIKENT